MKKNRKQLSDMTLEELWSLFPIILRSHNNLWARRYETEKKRLLKSIGQNNVERISHIGSTSVEGLIAKPTIDILLEITCKCPLKRLQSNMKRLGYIFDSQPNNPAPHMMFKKGYTEQGFKGQTYHVHVRYLGDWKELYFRDYLRDHPEIAKNYGDLKLVLKPRFEHNRDGYTDAKTEFIMRYTLLAYQEYSGRYSLRPEQMFSRLAQCENFSPDLFSNRVDCPFGIIYFNSDNPISYDSNHSLILRGNDIDKIISEIISFYQEKQIAPRIYSAHIKGQLDKLQPYFDKYGFCVIKDECKILVHEPFHNLPQRGNLDIQRLTKYDDDLFRLIQPPEEYIYSSKVVKSSLEKPNYYFFVGYADNVPVCTAAIVDCQNGFSRIEDVETVPQYRGHGYARELMAFIISYFEAKIGGTLYLWCVNPTAMKIYKEAGFAEISQQLENWSAYLVTPDKSLIKEQQ